MANFGKGTLCELTLLQSLLARQFQSLLVRQFAHTHYLKVILIAKSMTCVRLFSFAALTWIDFSKAASASFFSQQCSESCCCKVSLNESPLCILFLTSLVQILARVCVCVILRSTNDTHYLHYTHTLSLSLLHTHTPPPTHT